MDSEAVLFGLVQIWLSVHHVKLCCECRMNTFYFQIIYKRWQVTGSQVYKKRENIHICVDVCGCVNGCLGKFELTKTISLPIWTKIAANGKQQQQQSGDLQFLSHSFFFLFFFARGNRFYSGGHLDAEIPWGCCHCRFMRAAQRKLQSVHFKGSKRSAVTGGFWFCVKVSNVSC